MSTDRRRQDRRRHDRPVAEDRRTRERRGPSRRRSRRVEVEIWVEELLGRDRYMRRTHDLSEDGVFFDVALPSPVGSQVTLRFTVPGDRQPIVAYGEVATVGAGDKQLGIGVRFTRFDGDGKRRLREFLRSVAG